MPLANRNGFTYILALTLVVIMGIMLGMTGKSWKLVMQREREKELLFRGSQIKEAIENWNNLNYRVPGVPPRTRVHPLMDLKDLLQDPYSLTPIRYLPPHYAAELDERNPRCAPDCPRLKVYEDPMTGREWTIIREAVAAGRPAVAGGAVGGRILGVASKSEDEPFRTDFRDTSLENITAAGVGTTTSGGSDPTKGSTVTTAEAVEKRKYSDWRFVAESNSDHSKIYRSYHEGW